MRKIVLGFCLGLTIGVGLGGILTLCFIFKELND